MGAEGSTAIMTMVSTNRGIAVTNVPVKPLRGEGIRCMKLSRGLRSNPGTETIPATGLSTAVAQAGVSIRPASGKGRDPRRLRGRHRSSRTVKAQHLQLALLNSRSLSWQRPTTGDKLYDLIFYVRKLKINVECISEMKNFNPGGDRVSFVVNEEYMFILAESSGILLDPRCRVAFHNGGSTLHVGSERSLLIKRQFSTGSFAVGAVYFPTVVAAMRDLELVNVLSLISLAKSWNSPAYFGGDWNGHIENDHGVDDTHIGQYTSKTATIPKGFVFACTFANADLFLEDSFIRWSEEVRGGTTMEPGMRTMWCGPTR